MYTVYIQIQRFSGFKGVYISYRHVYIHDFRNFIYTVYIHIYRFSGFFIYTVYIGVYIYIYKPVYILVLLYRQKSVYIIQTYRHPRLCHGHFFSLKSSLGCLYVYIIQTIFCLYSKTNIQTSLYIQIQTPIQTVYMKNPENLYICIYTLYMKFLKSCIHTCLYDIQTSLDPENLHICIYTVYMKFKKCIYTLYSVYEI